jgi:hypothetical protein
MILPTLVDVADINITAAAEFSPKILYSVPTADVIFFESLFCNTFTAFSKVVMASYSLLIMFNRKVP